jgi:glycosyltransferase involved in cell wall biosynthesis
VRDVTVVVPFRNAERHVGRCLRALEGQLPFGGTCEIVMIDDGSTDGSAGVVAGFPRARLLSQERRGAYAARNRGVAASSGATIAFTDADCEPRPDWLRQIVEEMSDPSVAVVVGARRPAGRSSLLSLIAAYERAKDEFVFASPIADLYYGSGNNMAVRREVFDRLGPFSERRRGSDTLFVRRVVDALSPDAVRFLPELRVDHLEIATVRDYYRKLYVYGRSFRRFAPLGHVRPLTNRDRLRVWRTTVESRPPGDAAALLGALAIGVLFWWAGSLSGLVREAT